MGAAHDRGGAGTTHSAMAELAAAVRSMRARARATAVPVPVTTRWPATH